MRGSTYLFIPWSLASAVILFGCGYSQDEWDQKVRATEELRGRLAGERSARAKAEADYADALEEIGAIRGQLQEKGVDMSSLNAHLLQQKKALEEYKARAAQLDAIKSKFDRLRSKLEKLTRLGLQVDVRDNRMVIRLPGDVLFASGKDELKEDGKEIVLHVAKIIRDDKDLRSRHFQVSGHTDNRAFRGGYFKDNWGLSAMRARSVVVLLTKTLDDEGGGLPAKNWSAAGYGSTDSIANNATEEGRSRNRRVELVVQPDVSEMLNLNSLAKE